jgi:hypothetical protein
MSKFKESQFDKALVECLKGKSGKATYDEFRTNFINIFVRTDLGGVKTFNGIKREEMRPEQWAFLNILGQQGDGTAQNAYLLSFYKAVI